METEELNFQASLSFTLEWEGGYVCDKTDPGGETNFGISKRYHPDVDIKNLTREQAAEIYRKIYWNGSGANTLQWPLCLSVFDAAVNPGPHYAYYFLRLAHALSKPNPVNQALYICDARMRHYQEEVIVSPMKVKYLKGWGNRVAALREVCLKPAPVKNILQDNANQVSSA